MQLAVAQASVKLGDVEANLRQSQKLLEQAQATCEGGLDLLVLPELFLTGYLLRDDYTRVAEAVPGDGSGWSNGSIALLFSALFMGGIAIFMGLRLSRGI